MARVGEDGGSGGKGGSGRRRKNGYDTYTPDDIPFVDAHEDIGEVPVGQLDTFVYPARDDKGVSSHVQFNLPPVMERAVKIVLRSNRFPYLDTGSFLRHAAARHLLWLVSIRHSLPKSMVATLESINESCRDAEIRVQGEEALQRLGEVIDRLTREEEWQEATRLVAMTLKRIDDTEPSSRQRHFKRQFLQRFSRFLVSGAEVNGGGGSTAAGFHSTPS